MDNKKWENPVKFAILSETHWQEEKFKNGQFGK